MASNFTLGYWEPALTLLLTLLIYVATKGWHSRRLFYKLRQQGLVCLQPLPQDALGKLTMGAYASLEHCHRQYARALTSLEEISKQCSSELLDHRIVKRVWQMGFGILPGPVCASKFS